MHGMIFDTFYFNGELDTLEVRLTLLDPVVDKFIILEASETFTGIPKPSFFLENKERYAKWAHKINYFFLPQGMGDKEILALALSSSNIGAGEHFWVREFYQKECLKQTLIGLKDEDMVFVSDVDEMWNPDLIPQGNEIYKLLQNGYIYYLNQRTDEDWHAFTGTIATKYKNIKNACLNHLRTYSKNTYVMVENGGWHFNALNGMQKKIDSFKHPVYTIEYMKTREKGLRRDNTIPKILLDNFPHLCLQ